MRCLGIRALLISGIPVPFNSLMRCWSKSSLPTIPGSLYRHFDIIDIPIAAAPKPFLAISGWKDILMEPRGTAAAHLSLRRAWEAAGQPENLGSLIFEAAHEFNAEMQQKVLEFFEQFL